MNTVVNGTVVEVSMTWLDGGRRDDFPVLTPYPATLEGLARALETFRGCADDGHLRCAAQLRKIQSRHVVANTETRFAAVVGDCLESDPPNGMCLIEIQDLPVCTVDGFAIDQDVAVEHLIDQKLNRSEKSRNSG